MWFSRLWYRPEQTGCQHAEGEVALEGGSCLAAARVSAMRRQNTLKIIQFQS